ncbi:MAG: hypothetical protein ACSHX0_12010 [Akkermansiaceae bacterium]
MKTKGKSAWIVEWHPHRDDIGITNLTPCILPRMWSKNKVLDFMRVFYWNSSLHCIFETQSEIHKRKSERVLISDSGARIDYSEYGGAVLIAGRVKDLRITWDKEVEVMEWTFPPHQEIDPESGRTIESTKPYPRIFRSTNQ